MFNSENEEEEKFGVSLTDKYGWYNSIYLLADEKLLNINKVTKMPIYDCLTFMAYKQDLNKKQQDEYRRN